MAETSKTNASDVSEHLSEAERMSRIRDLLVGPVIADETARRDESVSRLDRTIAEQSESIKALQTRISELEASQRAETERLDLRLLGIVESLLTDEQGIRNRIARSDQLRSYLERVSSLSNGQEKSG